MPRVLLVSWGASDDVLPFFALGRRLQAQGARPLLLLPAEQVERAISAGLPALELGLSAVPEASWQAPDSSSSLLAAALPISRRLFALTSEILASEPYAAVVSQPVCLASAWAARLAGLPSLVAHLSPGTLFTRDSLCALPWPTRLALTFFSPNALQAAARAFRPLCAELGIPWQQELLAETLQRPDLLLALWSPYFCLPRERAYRAKVICGFADTSAFEEELSAELRQQLAAGPPPLVFVDNPGWPPGFYEAAAAACRKLGRPGVVLSPCCALPDGLQAVESGPRSLLFAACAAVIHAGEIGQSAAAMRAGCPKLIVPLSPAQLDVARRLQQLGVARRVFVRLGARQLTAALAVLSVARQW